MAGERLSIRLTEPPLQQRQLEGLARRTGRTESELSREALSEYGERQQAGFLGCDEGGPDDLSVNPAHLEGFGRD